MIILIFRVRTEKKNTHTHTGESNLWTELACYYFDFFKQTNEARETITGASICNKQNQNKGEKKKKKQQKSIFETKKMK